MRKEIEFVQEAMLESKGLDSDRGLNRAGATRMDIVCKETAQAEAKGVKTECVFWELRSQR